MIKYDFLFSELVRKNRSYRRFDNGFPVDQDVLKQLIDLSRYTSSSKNRQPLRYLIVTENADCDFVASQLKWAWYLKNWKGPEASDLPAAYLIMMIDTEVNSKADFDAGIAAQTILLGAVNQGLGGCIIRTFNGYELSRYFNLPEKLEILMVLAIGKPTEEVIIDEGDASGSYAYYRDEEDRHHVPKRPLDELIINSLRDDQDR